MSDQALIWLINVVLLLICCCSVESQTRSRLIKDQFDERLLIKPLANGNIYAQFDFTTTLQANQLELHWVRYFRLFPVSIARLVSENDVEELHFSLTKGFWKNDLWGYPIQSRSTGAELNVWFSKSLYNPKLNWHKITSELSGQFCASINFADKAISVNPNFSFDRQATSFAQNANQERQFGFYANLATEAICTENLTPWKKLLPCFGKAGIASLLNAIPLLKSNYFSLSLDYQPVCVDSTCTKSWATVRQSLAVVFNSPSLSLKKQSWSFIKLFGNSIRRACPLATHSHILVDVTQNETQISKSKLNPEPSFELPASNQHESTYQDLTKYLALDNQKYAVYDVNDMLRNSNVTKLNIANIYSSSIDNKMISVIPPVTTERYLTVSSGISGSIVTRITNKLLNDLPISYLDIIPWYLRVYMHTLNIQTVQGQQLVAKKLFYQPALDRKQPHQIEFELMLPAQSEVIISFDFDKGFLKWTEYPPDANHGVYVGPAIITTHVPLVASNLTFDHVPGFQTKIDNWNSDQVNGRSIRIHTQPLLIHLPTPDFSMPYNVICLVGTVVSYAFCPIHNLTTKKVRILTNIAKPNLIKSILALFSRNKQS